MGKPACAISAAGGELQACTGCHTTCSGFSLSLTVFGLQHLHAMIPTVRSSCEWLWSSTHPVTSLAGFPFGFIWGFKNHWFWWNAKCPRIPGFVLKNKIGSQVSCLVGEGFTLGPRWGSLKQTLPVTYVLLSTRSLDGGVRQDMTYFGPEICKNRLKKIVWHESLHRHTHTEQNNKGAATSWNFQWKSCTKAFHIVT